MIDLAAEFITALRSSSGREALREALAPVVASEVRRALADQAEKLEPLHTILGCSVDAARKRCDRDAELSALGVRVGRSLRFKRSTVETHLSARGRR